MWVPLVFMCHHLNHFAAYLSSGNMIHVSFSSLQIPTAVWGIQVPLDLPARHSTQLAADAVPAPILPIM